MNRLFARTFAAARLNGWSFLKKSGCKDTQLIWELLAGSGVCVNKCSLIKGGGNNTAKFEMNFCMFTWGY
ncbi:hypothetical protein C7N43_34580 [Sphingobacteriales bacterium UPWRP_1]|nr:hypothetical protein C7N43_34580 [Sphingobacteriales bacterium UPWRP_1]